jgi:hypothetical protein
VTDSIGRLGGRITKAKFQQYKMLSNLTSGLLSCLIPVLIFILSRLRSAADMAGISLTTRICLGSVPKTKFHPKYQPN